MPPSQSVYAPCHGSTARPPEKRKEQQGSLRDSAKKKQKGRQRFARAIEVHSYGGVARGYMRFV
ncbi:type I-E CRISPR-associated endoribonuclease Cas2 [Sesbania bispinosa]|nr:type I-E CRISPR-associated endoribonuclease Cas2 [Sesbania bispinosa]